MQATTIYRDSIWLYAIPAVYKRATDDRDIPLVDDLIKCLINEGYLLPTANPDIFKPSNSLINFLKSNRIAI